MPRVLLIAVAAGVVVLGGVFLVLRPGPASSSNPPAAAVTRPDPPPAAKPAAPSATPAPKPAAPRAAARSSVAPKAPEPDRAATPAPVTSGTLVITSDVPGAQVFLDRKFIGATPVTADDVPPGSHSLNVSAAGYDAHVETIDVAPGSREIAIRFREVRLDLSIAVVHKHRMGSCRGRLIATAQGLRYDTTDKDDVFRAPLLELETFQVDYLEKNLRVQPRKGKRYDFTDPDGNADRLFVFHRDVERARERLRKGDAPGGQ